MKQNIGLITENRSAIPDYVNQIYSVFGDEVFVSTYSIDDRSAYTQKKETIILTSAFSSTDFPEVKKTLLTGKTLIPINLCLQRKSLLRLNAYPKGTKALLVNVTKFMAEETIAQLYQAGYSHIKFIPYYPGCEFSSAISLAVTPGETNYVPKFVSEIIDIGPRQIDIMTIVELAAKLKCEYILKTRRFFDFFDNQFSISAGVSIVMAQNQALDQNLSSLVQMFDSGLVGINSAHEVFDCNYRAASMLGKKRADILNQSANAILPAAALERCRVQQVPVRVKLVSKAETPYDMVLTPITRGIQYFGAFATLTPSFPEEHPGAMDSVPRKGHIAKYRFSDICGNSKEIKQTMELAKKMARTDSSVLITGESGTGKELFAHSIHNNSPREQGPFVAINCAALPDSLLESELFGYEEGAFTGAKKGGKIGLFELANTGSIFLDEIEGMAQSTQLKLLRVIQEREIMRLGGDKIIPIDVRIISASNQELLPLTNTGIFRRDLFYRVSTLPLELPPLRRRREDIFLLIEEFKNELHLTFVLTEEAKSMLIHYEWPGNIRELRNCVEYLGCQNVPVIEPENLPFTIREGKDGAEISDTALYNIETEILLILSQRSCGRKLLKQALARRGISITEGQLRRKLEYLKARGWIASGSGRGGSCITEEGIKERKNRLK